MKFSSIKKILLPLSLCLSVFGWAWGQNPSMDNVLPEGHLLENLPWMGDDGKIESKGLFDFEDIRGVGQKDLVLIYRQSVPVNELDKPHNQTLIVCFFDVAQQKYVKNFEDEGGTIHWIKVVKDQDKKIPTIVLLRDDLKGNQILKGYSFRDGKMKQVLEAEAPQVFVKFMPGFQGTEILVSTKEEPKDKGSAEHVISWNEAKGEFVEANAPAGGVAGWSGFSIAAPSVPIVEAKVDTKPNTISPDTAPAQSVKASHPSANGWWDEPLDITASTNKLKTELVPQYIKKGQIAVLGQKAKAFFMALQKHGSTAAQVNSSRASYYAAVASSLFDGGNAKDAKFYLKTALSFQADNPDALALKDKIK